MARQGGTYYLFSTGDPAGAIGNGNIQIRTSANLRTWTYAGTVFADKPAWITSALGDIPKVQVRPLTWVGGWPVTGRARVPVPGEAGPPGS